MVFPWHLYLMASIFILAGLNHFRNPRMYLKIIPPFFRHPRLLNSLTGILEILFGVLLCIRSMTSIGAIGIIILLVAVFPANVFMLTNKRAGFGLPKWLLLIRLPLQFLLIFWAYQYI